jgi:tetratricopeptide (TPR) repeat protein
MSGMHFRRDYSRPLFGDRKPQRNYRRIFFVFGLIIGGLLLFVSVNFDNLQATAMEVAGFAPTPTPLPGNLATVGTALMLAGDYDEAADLFEQALAQRPENVDYLYEYGKLHIELSDYDAAIALADRILGADPSDPRGYELKSRAQMLADNSSAAISVALAGLDLNRGYEGPLLAVLSRAYTFNGNYADGVDAGQRAVEADPNSVDARLAYANALNFFDLRDEALNQLETALQINPNHIQALFDLAFQYLARNQDQEAIDLYDRILALQPRNANANLWLCRSYKKVGQFERAVGYCVDATDLNPQSAGAFYELGMLRYRDYDFDASLAAFSECANINPDSLECTYRAGLSHYYVAMSQRDLGDTDSTNDHCEAAWNVLQDSLVMAQERFDAEVAAENIRTGLIAIEQDCPAYGGTGPINPRPINPEATPETDTSA